MKRSHWTTGAAMAALALLATPALAGADTVGTLFEPPSFDPGSINGQGGWLKTGSFDAAVVTNSDVVAAVFGAQSLRISNATTSGSFDGSDVLGPLGRRRRRGDVGQRRPGRRGASAPLRRELQVHVGRPRSPCSPASRSRSAPTRVTAAA